MKLAIPSIEDDALQIVYPLEVASATLRPAEGTDTMPNFSCAFSSHYGHASVEFAYLH